ncbi:uncharacterized protein MONOS_9719 [Monocercomonoides exilis]|uniref:uncharacterized protein n=1 Tax=Monocercomonoides exilis TaxID=2049356 RepID=UPI00355994FB|nr:hypothetical protein MONOS_9719 [Monocercomonoides exilis]|eukprot:MONOS_9719.1-p1 / transcript=MONOS_9719.1 / gene=MONOS_9719 / organism=Monocercomonoides_exilis_PA203 / gene_product=unspecified product / transcript_product=unspecified product / location=Mono_scaffold00412:763-1889(-) / protein_length=243 / sequence_SO=supercontig / SO=protein_coding / is_pseudo=false
MQHLISSSYQNAHDATVASALFSDANSSMKEDSDDVTKDEIRETPITHMFTNLLIFDFELFYELEDCPEIEQKVKILEMNEMVDEMDEEEFRQVFTVELFNRIDQMIEEKKLSFEKSAVLLKQAVALKKEESEEAQKEVEMALLALSCINDNDFLEQKLYLNEIREIIQYHQECRNLSHLAYQSAWKFLMGRFYESKSLEGLIVNELHFVREARRELEDLTRRVDWKKKEVERGKETKEEHI